MSKVNVGGIRNEAKGKETGREREKIIKQYRKVVSGGGGVRDAS